MGTPDRPTAPTSGQWEIREEKTPVVRLTSEQCLALVLQGRIGFQSQVRRTGEAAWGDAGRREELGFAFPHLNFLNWKDRDKYVEAVGVVSINPDFNRALAFSRKAASEQWSRESPFWFSAHVEWAGGPIIRQVKMFSMWPGFWVVPIVESTALKPGARLNVYLVAFNMTDKPVQRTIQVTDARVPLQMQGNLTFTLPAWRWTVQGIPIIVPETPGAYSVGFTTLTGEDRAATAVAVGLLTLGTVLYAPGSAGFYLGYAILEPEAVKAVSEWEEQASRAATERFDTAGAVGISSEDGRQIPKDEVLRRFRTHLTPSLVLDALKKKERGPEDAMRSSFNDFLLDSFGVTRFVHRV